jgi:HK97 gp10 family phage protein
MAVRGNLSMKGLERYLEDLTAAGANVDECADRALAAGGDVALEGMQRRAPEDTGNLKGKLAASAPETDGNLHVVRIGLAADVDAETARYGNAQEYGTASMPAQPYVRPTFDEDKSKISGAMRSQLKQDGKL